MEITLKKLFNILATFLSVTMQKNYKDIENSLEKVVTAQVLKRVHYIF